MRKNKFKKVCEWFFRLFGRSKKVYWYCQFGMVNGEKRDPEIISTYGESPRPLFNAEGNMISGFPIKIKVSHQK